MKLPQFSRVSMKLTEFSQMYIQLQNAYETPRIFSS